MRRAIFMMLGVLACQPQAEPDYPGEPLLTLRGQVKNAGPLPQLEAAMLWQRGDPPSMDQQDLATRAPVEATFPATFTVHLYHPPPEAARRTLAPGEPTYARANAAAIPAGIAASQVAAGPAPVAGPPSNYGVDANHWIIHLSSEAGPSSVTAWWLGGPMPAGFHVVIVTSVNPKCLTPDQLQACTEDLAHRGLVADAARALCMAPYRLSPAPPSEQLILDVGAIGLGGPGDVCP
jgi:hypothetical protein